MRNSITVFGTGYVGLVTGICLAELGYSVCCIDVVPEKIAMLKEGKSPIYERGMDELLKNNIAAGRIKFTTDAVEGIKHGDFIFIAVGTPSAPDGSADLRYVFEVAESIGKHLDHNAIVVNKSTVPVGTGDKVRSIISEALQERKSNITFDVVSNPEFLKQGDAIQDFMRSDRIIVGANTKEALNKMQELYKPLNARIVTMDIRSAELSKYAANAFLASRISFMNDIACLAEKLGADVEAIRQGVATDPRIGPHFLLPGCGYGGSCFPKDVKALIKMAEEQALDGKLFRAIENINDKQKKLLFKRLEKHFKGDLKGKVVALWGLAFKPHTDDMRDAPSRTLLELLWRSGVKVQAYDPVAMQEAKRIYGDRPDFLLCNDAISALQNADLLMIVTEWDEFRKFDLDTIKKTLKNNLIFDGRNIYDPEQMQKLGFDYYCIGRRFGKI